MQITGRLMRRGQERPVVIKRFTTTGGTDEIYNRMLDESVSLSQHCQYRYGAQPARLADTNGGSTRSQSGQRAFAQVVVR
jgi:hypothetical protein